jgi:hypothetical protein
LLTLQPQTDPFPKTPTHLSSLAGLAFALIGVIDFTATGMADHIAYHYWSSQTPVRLLFLFGLTAYSYLYKPAEVSKFVQPSPGDVIRNGFVFTWAFVELGFWFLIYISLREERQAITTSPRDEKSD